MLPFISEPSKLIHSLEFTASSILPVDLLPTMSKKVAYAWPISWIILSIRSLELIEIK